MLQFGVVANILKSNVFLFNTLDSRIPGGRGSIISDRFHCFLFLANRSKTSISTFVSRIGVSSQTSPICWFWVELFQKGCSNICNIMCQSVKVNIWMCFQCWPSFLFSVFHGDSRSYSLQHYRWTGLGQLKYSTGCFWKLRWDQLIDF